MAVLLGADTGLGESGILQPCCRNDLSTNVTYPGCSTKTTERKMRDILRTVLRAISAAWAKRRHDAQRDKIEDKMVADLEAIVANMKRRARAGRTRPERDTAHGLVNRDRRTRARHRVRCPSPLCFPHPLNHYFLGGHR